MKKKIMEKWVEALRSGEFKQGQSYLDKDGKYCCLGVLCVLALNEGVVRVSEGSYGIYDYGEDRLDGALPKEVLKWSGMKNEMGQLIAGLGTLTTLSRLNDGGLPFTEISKIIEKYWKEL